jgi:hypothetical protein
MNTHANCGIAVLALALLFAAPARAEEVASFRSAEADLMVRDFLHRLAEPPNHVILVQDQCAPAWQRACHDNCGGNWGLFCFFGDVCNPQTHNCEHAQP